MFTCRRVSLTRHALFLCGAALLAAATASAQSSPRYFLDSEASSSTGYSSSLTSFGTGDGADAALPAAPSASGAASSAAGSGQGYNSRSRSIFSRMAFEAGGGFNAPSRSTGSYLTYGGNFTVGAGFHLNEYVSMLAEYQFIDDKLPGAIIADAGTDGGHAHIWSFTLAPVVNLMPKSANSIYITGGGGFYRKVTSFTDLQLTTYCDYFYCEQGYTPQVVGHFSSNQGGWNIGAGYQHRLGGVYGDGKMKLFAEARYLDIDTPAVYGSANGLGVTRIGAGTKLVPVTLGIRF